MAYTQILYHIIIRTKYSDKALELEKAPELYKYIWGIIKNKGCVLYRINGMEDHIHMLCDLHPTVPLADLIKAIKGSSGKWIKASGLFPKFRGWGIKYCALTYAYQQKEIITKLYQKPTKTPQERELSARNPKTMERTKHTKRHQMVLGRNLITIPLRRCGTNLTSSGLQTIYDAFAPPHRRCGTHLTPGRSPGLHHPHLCS